MHSKPYMLRACSPDSERKLQSDKNAVWLTLQLRRRGRRGGRGWRDGCDEPSEHRTSGPLRLRSSTVSAKYRGHNAALCHPFCSLTFDPPRPEHWSCGGDDGDGVLGDLVSSVTLGNGPSHTCCLSFIGEKHSSSLFFHFHVFFYFLVGLKTMRWGEISNPHVPRFISSCHPPVIPPLRREEMEVQIAPGLRGR